MGWFSGEKAKVRQYPAWSPEQQKVGTQLGTRLQTALDAGIGEQVSGLLSRYLAGTDPLAQQAETLLSQYMTGGGLEPEATRGYLEDVIYGPMRKILEEETLPGIQAAYGKGGTYFSTPRAAAETKARAGTEEEFGRIAKEIAYQELMASKARQMEALGYGLQYPAAKIGAGAEYEQSMLGQIQQYLQQEPYQYVVKPGTQGLGPSLIGAGGQIGGQIAGQAVGAGKCCFMFIMGEGNIIDQVQKFKHEHFGYNSYVANGYRWMSLKLMPYVTRNNFVRGLVKNLITRPLSKFAEHYYNKDLKANLYAPAGLFWTITWNLIGRITKYNSDLYQNMVKVLNI